MTVSLLNKDVSLKTTQLLIDTMTHHLCTISGTYATHVMYLDDGFFSFGSLEMTVLFLNRAVLFKTTLLQRFLSKNWRDFEFKTHHNTTVSHTTTTITKAIFPHPYLGLYSSDCSAWTIQQKLRTRSRQIEHKFDLER